MMSTVIDLRLIPVLLGVGSAGCAHTSSDPPDPAADMAVFYDHGLIHDELALTHLSHTCDLTVDQQRVEVWDLRQLMVDMDAPRGLNSIVLVSNGGVVTTIPYVDQRPLRCSSNQLLVFGILSLNNEVPEGNLLTFYAGGKEVTFGEVPWTQLRTLADEKRGEPFISP